MNLVISWIPMTDCTNRKNTTIPMASRAEWWLCSYILYKKDAMSSLRWFIAGRSKRRHVFDPSPVHVMFLWRERKLHRVLSRNSVFPFQYHSTTAPYSFIHLPPTLYNVFLPVLQFSPVSIIPPLLHTHSFIYHPRCIIFFSQQFSFPLSVSFHHCSILIRSSTTHAV